MKLLLLTLTIVLCSGYVAQNHRSSLSTSDGASEPLVATEHSTQQAYALRGAPFFTEDFLNGFDGNNELGLPITVTDSGGDVMIWRIADENSPCGEFSANTMEFTATTVDNGYAIFDADCWNTPVADGVFDVQGFLELPVMDLSARNTVVVEWEQKFRYCCFTPSPITIGVSIDGGVTYSEFPAHGDFIEGANDTSGNLTTAVDISCIAASESDVRIRWGYNADFTAGYSHYFWQIDDIRLFEIATDNDLEIKQISTGDIVEYFEYSALPIVLQRPVSEGGLRVYTIYTNQGALDQTDVVADYVITNSLGEEVYNGQYEIGTALAAANALTCPYIADTVFFDTGWNALELGDYLLTVTLSAEGIGDATPANNVLTRPFEITSLSGGAIGTDFPDSFDAEYRPLEIGNTGVFRNGGYGTFFHTPVDGYALEGVIVNFGDLTMPDTEVTVGLYEMPTGPADLNGGDTPAVLVAIGEYEIQEFDIPTSVDTSFETYIPFSDIVDLVSDTYYFVFISREEESEQFFSVYGNLNSDTDNSSREIELSGGQEYLWFTSSGAFGVRGYLEVISTIEENEISGLGLEQNSPNPFEGESVITYTLDNELPLSFEVKDVSGKTVRSTDLGTLPAGQYAIEINSTDYQAGVYFYSLISGDSRTTRKMIITD